MHAQTIIRKSSNALSQFVQNHLHFVCCLSDVCVKLIFKPCNNSPCATQSKMVTTTSNSLSKCLHTLCGIQLALVYISVKLDAVDNCTELSTELSTELRLCTHYFTDMTCSYILSLMFYTCSYILSQKTGDDGSLLDECFTSFSSALDISNILFCKEDFLSFIATLEDTEDVRLNTKNVYQWNSA